MLDYSDVKALAHRAEAGGRASSQPETEDGGEAGKMGRSRACRRR